ncbi:MAG TPA: hypothetical protein VGL38_14330 [bacterium]|jgi:hypothetical protein
MRTRFAVWMLIGLFSASPAFCHHYYTGYSNAPGSSGSCAGSCHGAAGGTVSVTGFPSTYTPGQTYLIHVAHGDGGVIANFNSSCRIGTGSANAGSMAGVGNTQTYSATGETSGVAMMNAFQDTASFAWTAPPAGTGTVRLYLAAHQSLTASGLNSALVQIAGEIAPPDAASNPYPANSETSISRDPVLTWAAGSGATSHDVYFGTNNTPPLIGNQTTLTYSPSNLAAGTVYYWHVNERNGAGATAGPLWSFTTTTGTLASPQALVVLAEQPLIRLNWRRVNGAGSYKIYRASTPEVLPIPVNLVGSTADTTYTDANALTQPALREFYTVTAVQP